MSLTAQALGGIITLPQLSSITGLPPSRARLLAERWAGPGRSRRQGRHLILYWPLPPLADMLGGRGIPGILPGGWVTLHWADTALSDLPAATRRSLFSGRQPQLRQRTGRSRSGTICRTYALADILALLSNPGANTPLRPKNQ